MKKFKWINSLFYSICFIVINCFMSNCSKGSEDAQEPIDSVVEHRSLQELIKPGFLLGTRVMDGTTSVTDAEIAQKEFNLVQVTCFANYGGWPSRYLHDISKITSWANWASSNNKKVMAHFIIGRKKAMPDWFTSGNWTAAELETLIDERMLNLVAPLKDKVHVWNVVNEALADSYSGFTGSSVPGKKGFRPDDECIFNRMGWEADASGLEGAYNKVNDSIPVYIRKSFEHARKYTNAELELRDYGCEFSVPRLREPAFYQLVKHLINKNTPLDAVGLQTHISGVNAFDETKYNWDQFRQNIRKYKDLGLKVYLTEVDISTGSFENKIFTPEIALLQKNMYKRLVKEAMDAGVDGICFWGVADGEDKTWRTYDKPLLYDENFKPKPAYWGVHEALEGK